MSEVLKILILEDSPEDVEVIQRLLKKEMPGCVFSVKMTREGLLEALEQFKPDLILSDNAMPQFNATEALAIVNQRAVHIPFILVTGTVSEEFAVGIIKTGADDYILKDRIARLPVAIETALSKRKAVIEKKEADEKVMHSEANLRAIFENTSEGFLLIDREGMIKTFNQKATTYSFFSRKNNFRLGCSVYGFIEEGGKPVFRELFSKVLNGESIHYERPFEADNGAISWLDFSITPVWEEGVISGICVSGRDITQRKKAETEIRDGLLEKLALAERMSTILNSLPANIALLDGDGFIVDVNDGWRRFADQNEFIGANYTMGDNYLKTADAANGAEAAYGMTAASGIRKVLENRSNEFTLDYPCHSAKEKRWFRMIVTPLQKKERTDAIVMHINITEQKKGEEALKITLKDLSDYKNALDESSLVDISDSDGIMRHVNEKFCKLSKYSREELIGENHRILNSGYHPGELFQNLWHTITEGKIWRNEVRNRAKDASYFWVDTTIVPFLDNDGKPFQFITIRSDITKRKNAEALMAEAVERYDILADATSDTIWDWDIVNNTMLYNDGIYKMFGYKATEVENVIDWWNEKLHSDDFKTVKDSLEGIFENHTERFQWTYRFRCADGSYKHIFDRAVVIFDKDGKPTRMIGAMQDITYQSEEELRIAKATLDAQEAERNNLGAELHDNINQILAGTLLTLGMAKSKEVDAPQRAGFINSAMGYITDAINETRKLSHSLAPASFEDNSLKDLFENLLFTVNLENQFTVSLDFDEIKENVIPENIQVNLYRILQEQTKNILKYAKASTIEITVKIIDNAVRLRIYDNGKGFDTKPKKTGIGLSNIKKRAESLSGKFILNSAPGKGCEIIVEIPLGK